MATMTTATVSTPPSYADAVPIDAMWRPDDDLVIDTTTVPMWPGVRPFFGPDGSTVLSYLTKFVNNVFFNGGYSANKGSLECKVKKSAINWKKDNKIGINNIVKLTANERNGGDFQHSTDWLFRTESSKIKKIPKDSFSTHGIGPTLEMFRGTWIAFEIAPSFLRYCFPPLRTFWDKVMLKSHLGQLDFFPKLVEIADHGRADGFTTENVAIDMMEHREQKKRTMESDETNVLNVKRARKVLQPLDIEFWLKKGCSFGDAIDLIERGVTVYERKLLAEATTTEVLIEQEKGKNIVLATEKVLHEEEAKRETNRQLYESSVAAQAALFQVDINFHILKQLNWTRTENSRTGPCLYFSIQRNFILYGQTSISFNKRYCDGKLDDTIIDGCMLVLPARDGDDAKVLERSWNSIISSLAIRRGKRERFVGEWSPFVRAVEQWNNDHKGRPDLYIVMPLVG